MVKEHYKNPFSRSRGERHFKPHITIYMDRQIEAFLLTLVKLLNKLQSYNILYRNTMNYTINSTILRVIY